MCLEFTFAFIYFLILLFINFFLFKIIKDSFKKTLQLEKFKKSFKLLSSSFYIPFLYFYLEKGLYSQKLPLLLSTKKLDEDLLIIGNFYKLLQQRKTIENSFFYYINLQEKQYKDPFPF